ncbi:MAG: DNA polymerase III subunit delta [Candidatus Scalindua sp.]|nr:DNA polymerase III subunit delta [Candidatus Scalindua sp.]
MEFLENQFNSNCLVLNVLSLDKRKKIVKALNGNKGVLIECNKLYDSPAPWEKEKAEYDSELTKWIVMHAEGYGKKMDMKTAFSLLEKTGNDLAIIDKQIEILSIYVGGRKQITEDDIQKVLGVSQREKIYHLLDAIGGKDFVSAMRMVKVMFDTGIENERKNIIYDEKVIAIAIISSLHKRMRDLWKSVRIINKGGSDEEIMENTSQKRIFIDKIRRQAQNFNEEEMPDKWRFMLEADLLCKTSNLSPVIIIEQLTAKLCI